MYAKHEKSLLRIDLWPAEDGGQGGLCMKIGFDNEKYLKMQSEHIKERISQFGDKLYLEFGSFEKKGVFNIFKYSNINFFKVSKPSELGTSTIFFFFTT